MGEGKLFAFDFSTMGGDEMPNGTDNLVPLSERTKEEQREIARKGGRASGKARRKKRTAKETARLLLSMPAPASAAELMRQYNIADVDCTNMTFLIARMIQLAQNGDIKAAQFVTDILGENPKYAMYEKRLELLVQQNGGNLQSIIDEWVSSIPEMQPDTDT